MIVYPNGKINIGLRILKKRDDGFHNIESVFYPVPIVDVLEITKTGENQENSISFTSSGIDIPGQAYSNIIIKAYYLINNDYPLPAIHVHLHKQIPIGAGLGGGSADAAFFIKALNTFDELNLSFGEMHHYAKQLGSDCSFFINNKPALALQKGDDIEPVALDLKGCFLVLVYPNIHISTQEAYAGVNPSEEGDSLEDLINLPMSEWKSKISNQFEDHIAKKYPVIDEIKSTLYEHDAIYASMTGSGSAVYGIFKEPIDLATIFKEFTIFQLPL